MNFQNSDPSKFNFCKEVFLQEYYNLSTSPEKAIRDQANLYIIEFQVKLYFFFSLKTKNSSIFLLRNLRQHGK